MHFRIKIWYGLCLFFSAYNLKLLIDDRYLTGYIDVEADDELYRDETVSSICIAFSEVASKNRLPIETGNVSIERFLRHSMASIAKTIHCDFPDASLFNLSLSYVHNKRVCFPFDPVKIKSKFLQRLISNYRTFFYTHSPLRPPFYNDYHYEKYDKLKYFSSAVVIQRVYGETFLNSGCLKESDQQAKNRLFCLDSCFKQIEPSEFNFYRFNENANLNLNLIQDQALSKKKNDYGIRATQDAENRQQKRMKSKVCYGRCPKSDCFFAFTYSSNKDSHPNLRTSDENELKIRTSMYRAFYNLSYFWLQFFGLVTLFTGTSLTVTLPALIVRLYDKVKFRFRTYEHFRYFQRYFPKFRFALLAFSFLYFCGQSFSMIGDYRYGLLFPNQTLSFNYTSGMESYTIVLCLALPENSQFDLTKNSVQKIANLTKHLDKEFEMHLLYGHQKIAFVYSISEKIQFKVETFNHTSRTARCLSLDITEFDLLKHQLAVPFATIRIRFQTPFWTVYLTDSGQPLTTSLVPLNGENFFTKKIYRYLEGSPKSNCKNYSKEANCRSRRHCSDNCYNQLFFQTHQTISTHSVVDLDDFRGFELASTHFNNTEDKNIRAFCENKFKQKDCTQIFFDTKTASTYNYRPNGIYLELNYLKRNKRLLDQSAVKLMLNILNLESILFGSNATSLLLTLFHLLKKAFKLKWRKAYRVLVFIICLSGFLAHNTMVFNEILHGDLVDNGFFEIMKSFEMPKIIFCSVIPNQDPNYQLTGNQLDKLTSDLTYESVFRQIGYYDKTYWKTLSPTNSSESADKLLSITHFYFSTLKCFEISLGVQFVEEDFIFKIDRWVLSVYFQESFLNRTKHVYFISRKSGSKELNSYSFRLGEQPNRSAYYNKYQLAFEGLVIKRDDKFERFKSWRNLFSFKRSINDVTDYLDSMKATFESDYNRTTKQIFLERKHANDFRLEIDDELFEQYSRQVQNQSDQNPTSLNYEKRFFMVYPSINNANDSKEGNLGEFTFTFYFSQQRSEFTNDDNFSKLVQSILNTLSLWLDTCILDVHLYLFKFFFVLKLFHEFLLAQKVRFLNFLETYSRQLMAPSQIAA